MFFKTAIIILVYLKFLSTTIIPITVYNNAQFNPIDTRYVISNLSAIRSANACLCECYNNIICFTATYFSTNETCLLFFAQLSQGQLRVVPTSVNAKVYSFGNKSSSGFRFFNLTNQTVHAIWNTTAGGNSSVAMSGTTEGTYWSSEPPNAVFDNNMTTFYTNHGSCNSNISSMSRTCGENTGLYFTLQNGPIILVAFRLGTGTNSPQRDPLTIIIEGSNLNGSALTLGSSWTLIYNGSSGLIPDPGRSSFGALQILPNVPRPFASYRLLVTSKRSIETCTSYSELALIGY